MSSILIEKDFNYSSDFLIALSKAEYMVMQSTKSNDMIDEKKQLLGFPVIALDSNFIYTSTK